MRLRLHSLATRIVLTVLAACVAGFAAFLLIQGQLSQARVEANVEQVTRSIAQNFVPPLAEARWILSDRLTVSIMEGVLGLPLVERVTVLEQNATIHTLGEVASQDTFMEQFPLRLARLDQPQVGELRVHFGLGPLREAERAAIMRLALWQAAQLCIVAAVLLTLLYRSLLKPLRAVARHAQALDSSRGFVPFARRTHDETVRGKADELDEVIHALNDMGESLQSRSDQLRLELIQRRKMERQLTDARDQLEARVQERTTELADANTSLDAMNDELTAANQELKGVNQELLAEVEERRRVEHALRLSEARQRTIVERMPVMLAAVDERGLVVAWNQECERVTGYPADAVLGRAEGLAVIANAQQSGGRAPDAQADAAPQDLAARFFANDDFRDHIARLVTRDGEERLIAWSSIAHSFPIPGWRAWAVGVDVTARDREQAALTRLNRTLEAMALAHRALQRESDLRAMCEEVCRVGVEAAGYDFVWVGLAPTYSCHSDHKRPTSPHRTVTPFASYGGLGTLCDDNAHAMGDSLAAAALRQQRPVFDRQKADPTAAQPTGSTETGSHADTPHDAPVRNADGFVSRLALPLLVGDTVIGVMCYCSHAENAFESADERALLERLADSLAHGVQGRCAESRSREAEEELRRSEALLKETQTLARVGGWELDMATGAIVWSAVTYEIFEATSDFPTSLQAVLDALFDPTPRAMLETALERCAAGEPFDLELPAHARTGEPLYVRVLGAAHMKNGHATRLVGAVQDITARKTAEHNFEAIFNHSPDMLSITHFDGRFLELNPAWERVLGWPAAETLGRPWTEFLHPDDLDAALDAHERLLHGERISNFENRFRHAEGGHRWLAWDAYPDLDRGLIFAASRDVTQLRADRLALAEAKAQAEAASQAKSEFLANMSHEIRTPLNGVLGMLQLLTLTPLDEDQRAYVDTAAGAGQSLLTLLSDILDLSRIEAGMFQLAEEPFCVGEVVDVVTSALEKSAHDKQLRLTTELADDLPETVLGDPGRLRQVLFNLVGNAIKFTTDGEVRIEASRLPRMRPDGRINLLFAVVDTGPGIDDNTAVRLFEPFTQAETSPYSREHQGAGLGLSIVKRLVHLMEGELCLDSPPGEGATFTIILPFTPADVSPALEEPITPTRLQDARILLAEDNEVNRFAIHQMLAKWGCRVTETEDGLEAERALGREPFDAAVLDVQMPHMSGLELIRRLREGAIPNANPAMPVLSLTAYAMQHDREALLSAGADRFLAKPVDMRHLKRELERLLANVHAVR